MDSRILAGVLLAGFLSDVFDGVVARRMGTVTAGLRHADTIVDTLFYCAAGVALLIVAPDAILASATCISALIVVHVSRVVFELTKYGRVASYHMWSARVWGVVLFVALERAFLTAGPTVLLTAALIIGIANEIEGFAASIVLADWHHDVPSVLHAVGLQRRDHAA